jgi:hypothetical protein
MRQYCREHMVVPPWVCAHFMVHPQFRFPFFTALLDGSPQSTEPHKGAQGRARRCMTDIVAVGWFRALAPLDDEPDGAHRQAVLTQRHPLAGQGIDERTLGPCRDLASIPGEAGSRAARAATGHASVAGATTTRWARAFPL